MHMLVGVDEGERRCRFKEREQAVANRQKIGLSEVTSREQHAHTAGM